MKSGGYEAHITADQQFHRQMEELAWGGWVYSQITGCPILGQGTYCYLTGYHPKDRKVLLEELNAICTKLNRAGVPVLRAKIEHIVYDTKTGVNEIC